jgi:uncharacterized coiled-coil protein SlyX
VAASQTWPLLTSTNNQLAFSWLTFLAKIAPKGKTILDSSGATGHAARGQTVQESKSIAAKQEASVAQQQKQIDALTAGLQKVSAQLQLSKAAPQTVLNRE